MRLASRPFPARWAGTRRPRTACSLSVECLETRCLLTFFPPVYYPVAGTATRVTTGDFNGDGGIDVASGQSILLNEGLGTFTAPLPHAGGFSRGTAVDFNLDQVLDLFASEGVLLGNSDGTLQDPLGFGGGIAAVGNFNGDAIPDLAAVDLNRRYLNVLLGNGDGTFRYHWTWVFGSLPSQLVAAADFDLDGLDDVAVFGTVFLNNGDGTLRPAGSLTAIFPNFIMAADLNADFFPDLVTASVTNSNVTVLLNNGDGTFQAGVRYQYSGDPSYAAAADFNLDSRLDIVASDSYSGTIGLFLGNGDGTLRSPIYNPVGATPFSVAVADFDNDAYPDIVTGNSGPSGISVFMNAGDWGEGAPFVPPLPEEESRTPVVSYTAEGGRPGLPTPARVTEVDAVVAEVDVSVLVTALRKDRHGDPLLLAEGRLEDLFALS